MRSISALCVAGFVAAAGVGSAMAADLPVRPGPAAAPMAAPGYMPDWTGFYFGINGGGGWAHTSFESAALTDTLGDFIPGVSPNGGVFGGHFGYNWQYGPVVGGIEGDVDWADLSERNPAVVGPDFGIFDKEYKIDTLASVRGRIGYSWLPNLLVYGTGGLGFAHSKLTVIPLIPGDVGDTADSNLFGWVAGAGLEYRWFEHILLRVEYLHYDFGKNNVSVFTDPPGAGTAPFPINIDTHVDVVRGGISYKF